MTPGLDQASALKPGQGWLAAGLRVNSDTPLAIAVDGGVKLTPDWAMYGDAWVKPTRESAGAEIGARFKNNLDIFAGAAGTLSGDLQGEVGLRWRF